MVDYPRLMSILSIPRPNGSAAERETRQALKDWIRRRGLPLHVHAFRIYPYFFELVGVWLIVTRTLLAVSIWLRWGWPALPIALIGLAGGLLDVALGVPLVTWPGGRQAENLLIEFSPQQAEQEIVLSAHYDSKSEPLDHHQRMFFLKNLRFGILISLLLAGIGPLDRLLLEQGSPWAMLTYVLGSLLSAPLLALAWGLGLNLSTGRLAQPSQGAVDNGAACAILLGLAEYLGRGEIALQRSRVTIALFTGEEVNMQGSRAYVRGRDWPLPTLALNLEVMAQNGPYVYWELDGSSLKLVPTGSRVNRALIEAVRQVTGQAPHPAGPINSDGYSFLREGIPAGVLGTYHLQLRDRGFHRPADNLERVTMARLPEGVEILTCFLQKLDREGVQRP